MVSAGADQGSYSGAREDCSAEGISPPKKEVTPMKKLAGKRKRKQLLPAGWTEKQVAEVAAYYDNQTEEEQLAEHQAARERPKRRSAGKGPE